MKKIFISLSITAILSLANSNYALADASHLLQKYDKVTKLNYSFTEIEKNGKKGVVYKDFVVEPEYDKIEVMGEDYRHDVLTEKNKKYGLIYKNKVVALPIYDKIYILEDSAFNVIEKNGKKGLIYADKIVIPAEYDKISHIKSTVMCIVEKDGKKGVVYARNLVLPVEYDKIYELENTQYHVIEKAGKMGVVYDKYISAPAEYDKVYVSGNINFAQIEKNGKKGLVHHDKIVAEAVYDDIEYTSYFDFILKKGEKYGLLDENDIIVPVEYDKVCKFEHFHLFFKGKELLLHEFGKKSVRTLKIPYENIEPVAILNRDYIKFKYNNKYGLIYGDKYSKKLYKNFRVIKKTKKQPKMTLLQYKKMFLWRNAGEDFWTK